MYIDDLGAIASSNQQADSHFTQLQATLKYLGLKEAIHKASPSPVHDLTDLSEHKVNAS